MAVLAICRGSGSMVTTWRHSVTDLIRRWIDKWIKAVAGLKLVQPVVVPDRTLDLVNVVQGSYT